MLTFPCDAMNLSVASVQKWFQPTVPVLSIQIHDRECPWVCGPVSQHGYLSYQSIEASGVCPSNPNLLLPGGRVNPTGVSALLEAVLGSLLATCTRPKAIVFSLPSRQHFLGNLTVSQDDGEEDIAFQVEDVLLDVAGDSNEPMAFDWQDKCITNASAERHLGLAAIHQSQLEALMSACAERKLRCLGVTLDNIAALNGYLQGVRPNSGVEHVRFLLLGEMNPHAVRLSVFVDGMPFHETWDQSEEGFSAIQAISAMEGLVAAWARSVPQLESKGIGLILGGSLMGHKSTEQIVKRSSVLSPRWIQTSALKDLARTWHATVVPYGAVEGMPCA